MTNSLFCKMLKLAVVACLATSLTHSAPAQSNNKKEAKRSARPPAITTTKWDSMDLGPFFSGYLNSQNPGRPLSQKTISIQLGKDNEAAMAFDTERVRMVHGWTGGFIKLPFRRDGLEGFPEVVGETVFAVPTGPGWAKGGKFEDPRPRFNGNGQQYGPMPRDWAHWRGLYLNGDQVVLSYTVGNCGVLELPGVETAGGVTLLTRTIQMEATPSENALVVLQVDKAQGTVNGNVALLTQGDEATGAALIGSSKGAWDITPEGRLHLKLPKSKETTFKIALWHGPKADTAKFEAAAKAATKIASPKALTKGGPARWTTPVTTKGKLGTGDGPYVVDTITVPEDNPWKSWIRCSGLDFFKDGRVAICSVSGDVWIVSGVDAKLENLAWKRYATGLFQPLGLKIVDDRVYVLGRDQITRLHDLNKDDEADFYENFNNDVSVTSHYHEFCLNLETDSKGNFYFIKGGNLGDAQIPHHGCLMRVSKDGSKLDIVATGHRAPNGLGVGPADQITSADNEGNWVPTSRVNLVKPGGFYGHVFTAHAKETPTDYDKPIFWLPHQIDNSSGGQTWVTSDKWGPFKGDMLHTSYGKCTLFKVMYEEVNGQVQGGVVRFPLNFDTGIMRGKFSPFDGQLYLAGLRVWQSSGAREGAFQRVRYTGKPVQMPKELHVKKNGVEITFTAPLDPATAADAQNYAVDQWNYHWTRDYGSKLYSAEDPDKVLGDKGQATFRGEDVEVKSVKLSTDKKTVFIEIPDVKPVMQMRIRYNIDSADGNQLRQEIFNTINRVPAS
ncbi:MAG: DUF6797 domain-containing protein [Verrucomicrobiota bacterium]